MGLGCLLNSLRGLEKTARSIAGYKEAVSNAKPVGKFINGPVMVSIMTHCDESNRRAQGEVGR